MRVIAAIDHPLAQQPRVTAADLSGETILLTEPGCGYRHLFEQALTQQGQYGVVKLDFNSVEAIKQCVIAGLGIGFLPEVAIAEEIAVGKLCALNWERPFTVYTQIVWHKDKWISPIMQAFLDITRQVMA